MSSPNDNLGPANNGNFANGNGLGSGKTRTPPDEDLHRYVTDDQIPTQRKAQIPTVRGSGQQISDAGLIVGLSTVSSRPTILIEWTDRPAVEEE